MHESERGESQISPEDQDLLHFHPYSERGRVSDEPIDPENGAFREIVQAIEKSGGQIPYSEFMRISLFGSDGYYSKAKAQIGAHEKLHHFSTSPEESPAFGGAIGQQMARVWESMGKPENFRIVELGGGTGAMAKSLLESVRETNPDFHKALSYTILEYGDLISEQQAKIPDSEKAKVTWVQGSATDLPFQGIEGAIISNEVPDAFPIERVIKVDGQIKQKYVTVDKHCRFFEVLGEPSEEVLDYVKTYNINLIEKTEEPINLNAVKFQKDIDQALKRGVVLTIDYGQNHEVGVVGSEDYHSLRFKGHPFDKQTGEAVFLDDKDQVDDIFPYKYPGQIDITARVNFKVLSEIARENGLSVAFSGSQEQFLKRAGIYTEVRRMESADDRSKAEKLLNTTDGYGSFYAQLLSKGLEFHLPSAKSHGPTPFEHSGSVFEEVTKELGFVENERLRMLRVILTNLIRQNNEPTIPEEEIEETDYPPEVIITVRKYQQTAEALYKQIMDSDNQAESVKLQLGLDLAYARMYFEGGWKDTARKRVNSARWFADEMGVQFPGLFERVVAATSQPSHS